MALLHNQMHLLSADDPDAMMLIFDSCIAPEMAKVRLRAAHERIYVLSYRQHCVTSQPSLGNGSHACDVKASALVVWSK